MMACILPMKHERREFADEVVRGLPDLHVGVMGDCDVSDVFSQYECQEGTERVYLLSGEKRIAWTGFLKLKWWRTTARRKLTNRARPSVRANQSVSFTRPSKIPHRPSSTAIRTCPFGLSAIAAIFLRVSNGRVRDLLLRCNRQLSSH